jgi:hypothetical protein
MSVSIVTLGKRKVDEKTIAHLIEIRGNENHCEVLMPANEDLRTGTPIEVKFLPRDFFYAFDNSPLVKAIENQGRKLGVGGSIGF